MTLQSVEQEKQENRPFEGKVAVQELNQARNVAEPYDHFRAHWSDHYHLYSSLSVD